MREGQILEHCVGRMNYDQKFVREESLIFFIRTKEAPNTPLVTVEYSPSRKKILQCYGKKDSTPNDNILEFVNKKWLPFANRQIKNSLHKGENTMANYYRITAYHKEKDISIIMDSYGYFEKKWQFSADLIRRGFDIIEVSDDTQFLDGNIDHLTKEYPDKFILRANATGKPEYIKKISATQPIKP